tara:strand:+ start:875 stop:1084 length:210 start_codon:yes stop_codon:yes gene_type:complete
VIRVFASVMLPKLFLWVSEHNFLRSHLTFLNAQKAALLKVESHDSETGHAPDANLAGELLADFKYCSQV